MLDTIRQHLPQIETLRRKHHVVYLSVFGSAVGNDFDPARSDLDFLVEFDTSYHAWDDYCGLQEGLAPMFNRHVDLIHHSGHRNPYVRRSVEATGQALYAA